VSGCTGKSVQISGLGDRASNEHCRSVNFGYANPVGIAQFRPRFSIDDNNNLVADYLKF